MEFNWIYDRRTMGGILGWEKYELLGTGSQLRNIIGPESGELSAVYVQIGFYNDRRDFASTIFL
jgi:hypothetical protein